MTQRSENALSFCAATAIGLAISTGHPVGLAAAAGMPIVCLLARSRKNAFESTLGYYTAGLWPMIPGLQRYIGSSASPLIPFAIWLFAATLLSMPWTVAWTDRPAKYVWRVPLAFVATDYPATRHHRLHFAPDRRGLSFPVHKLVRPRSGRVAARNSSGGVQRHGAKGAVRSSSASSS